MKTLVIVRHAKSNWDDPDVSDFDRPLNKRGNKDAPIMAKLIMEKIGKPDLIYSSPANRALTTARYFAVAMDYNCEAISQQKLIYEHGGNAVIRMLSKTDPAINTVMLFGHNPDMTSLSNFLSNETIGNLPTCGVVCIDFATDTWENIGEKPGKQRFFEYPKKHLT